MVLTILITLLTTVMQVVVPPTASEAAPIPPIKASQVLANARSMLGVRYVYGGNDPKLGLDCSAYVSRAWDVPRRTTDTMHTVARVIGKDEILPGDALNRPLAGEAGHIRIFDKWATTDKALAWVYDATEPEVIHHVVPYDPRVVPLRRLNIVSDVPMPPPPPLPAGKVLPKARPEVVANGVLAGQVVDEATGRAIANARIFYWTAQEQYRPNTLLTDASGRFSVPQLTAGNYEIAAYATGYDVEMDGDVKVNANRTTVLLVKTRPMNSATSQTRLQSGASTISGGETVPVVAPSPATAPTSLPMDYPIPGGYFFTQTAGRDGISGFAITNEDGIGFWDEFQRLGGVQGLGYPISRRFSWKGFTVQAMQKGVLQWRPEVGRAWLTNVFDELHESGKDNWLASTRSTPNPLPGSFDAGKDWGAVVRSRTALLDGNAAMKAKYNSVADPMTFFGLPTSRVSDQGNHYAIRLQRAVIQVWKVDVPWAKAGEVTVANGADVAKEAGLYPTAVLAPIRSPLLKGS